MLKVINFFIIINLAFASDVLELKDSNFDQKVSEHSIILVEFYAPWCGHCKKLAPEYEEAATQLQKADPPISIAKVDCTAETKTCEQYGVSGYPTLKIFRNGQFSNEYEGDRSGDGIVKYMISKSGPVSREITNENDLAKVASGSNAVVFGFFAKEGSQLHLLFQRVAEKLNEDIKFVHTFKEDLAKKIDIHEGITIIYPKLMASKFEEPLNRYTGNEEESDIKDWVETNIMGIAGLRTSSNSKYFVQKPLIVAYYNADYEKNPKGTNYWRNRILKVGKKFIDSKTKIHFAISNSVQLGQELSEYGIENVDPSKVFIAARNDKDEKFKMSDEFSVEAFEKFVGDFVAGTLTAYLKSEPVPDQSSDAVRVVVAKNFEEVVNDPSKDVLIEFYAPWCGHCQSLAPKYVELAQKLAKEPEIVIAKMDATANDVPSHYQVTGFPTIYFVPRDHKTSPRPYKGAREVDDFVKYIAAEATSPLNGFDRQGKVVKSDL